MFSKKALNVSSVILGIIFIISGIGKITNVADFSILISQYGFPGLKFLAPIIILIEFLLGLFLIFLIYPKISALFSTLLLIAFTGAFTYANFKHGINNCGCFGSLKLSELPPAFTYFRNLVLMLFSVIIWLKYPAQRVEKVQVKNVFIIGLMTVAVFLTGYTLKSPIKFNMNNQKDDLIGENIKNTELSKYASTSEDSTYLIFCFSYNCPHCLNSIENLKQYEKTKTVDRLILIVSESEKDQIAFNENFQLDLPLISLHADTLLKITDVVPTAFYIKNNIVQTVIKSTLPSHFIFKKYYIKNKELNN